MDFLESNQRHEADLELQAAASSGFIAANPLLRVPLAELDRRDAFLYLLNGFSALDGWHNRAALYEAIRKPTGDHRPLAAELRSQLVANKSGPTSYILLNAVGDYDRPLTIPGLAWLGTMQPYRRSPQFKQHTRAAGIYDYWNTYGFPHKCRAVGNDDFECN
jgi:hypothetical protein